MIIEIFTKISCIKGHWNFQGAHRLVYQNLKLSKVFPKVFVFLQFYLFVIVVESFIKSFCIQSCWDFQGT
jgi:hypothetical protein